MRREPRKLERWRSLAARERWLLVRAAMLLSVTTALLHVVGFRWTRRIVAGSNAGIAAGEIDSHGIATAERIGRLVDVAGRRGLVAARCLPRALVLCRLLRQHGMPAQLRIGVGKASDELFAHAWVEIGSHAVNEPESTLMRYAAYETLDPIKGV